MSDQEPQERIIQKVVADFIMQSPNWPAKSRVIPFKQGDIVSQVEKDLGLIGLCAVVEEPDDIQSIYGEVTFAESSKWTISVFTEEVRNKTGLDNLAASTLIRRLLGGETLDVFAEPISRCHVRLIGRKGDTVCREVTFTCAYQG